MKTLAIRKLHLTIILGCLTMTSAWGQKTSMQFDKMQIAQTDQNYQPIERTSKTKQQSGTIQIFKDEIRIIQSNTSNYQKFTITKYRNSVIAMNLQPQTLTATGHSACGNKMDRTSSWHYGLTSKSYLYLHLQRIYIRHPISEIAHMN